jgi:hypothetical protein
MVMGASSCQMCGREPGALGRIIVVRRPDLQLRAERVTDEQELAKQQATTTGNKKGRLLPQLAACCQSIYPQATFASLTTLGACATI